GETFIDRRVPSVMTLDGKTFDPAQFLNVHEQSEHALMEAGKMPYETAHRVATALERQAVEAAGIDWYAYEAAMRDLARKTEAEAPKAPPADLYTKPYPHNEAEFLKAEAARAGETSPTGEVVDTPTAPQPARSDVE